MGLVDDDDDGGDDDFGDYDDIENPSLELMYSIKVPMLSHFYLFTFPFVQR